jgi:hypothetical protein
MGRKRISRKEFVALSQCFTIVCCILYTTRKNAEDFYEWEWHFPVTCRMNRGSAVDLTNYCDMIQINCLNMFTQHLSMNVLRFIYMTGLIDIFRKTGVFEDWSLWSTDIWRSVQMSGNLRELLMFLGGLWHRNDYVFHQNNLVSILS